MFISRTHINKVGSVVREFYSIRIPGHLIYLIRALLNFPESHLACHHSFSYRSYLCTKYSKITSFQFIVFYPNLSKCS